jgi:REP element-mobilizing transposase RayT
LEGDIKVRCRDLLMQICDSEDVGILSGVVSKDHVHCFRTLVEAMRFQRKTLVYFR